MKYTKISGPIAFYEKEHRYVNIETKEEYQSITRFIHNFQQPFDEEYYAKRIAKRDWRTIDDVLLEWEEKRNTASEYGNKLHSFFERMFKSPGRIVIPADEYEEKLLRAYHETKGLDLSGDVISEDIIYNHTYKLAGQSDIIHIVDNKTFDIGDWKTNGNFRYFDPYKKYLKKPLTHLQQCEYNSYSIQLSSYAYFYELLTGMKCRRIFVIYFLRENDSLQVVPMNYLKSDIQNMLDYYQKNLVN